MMPEKPPSPHDMSDRQILEAVYRAVYGEEPVQPGLAKRVSRLELYFLLLFLSVAGFNGIPLVIDAIGVPRTP
jgi:hypothetical protein